MTDENKNSPEGNNAGGDKKPAEGLSPEDLKALKGSIETLSGGVKEILTMAQKRAQEQALERQNRQEPELEPDEEPDDVALETMNRRAFSEHLLKSFQKNLDTALKPLTDAVGQARTATATLDIKQQVEQFQATHADFGDWKDEMLALAKDNPTLSVSRLYNIVRMENASKAMELDKKYKKDEKKDDEPTGRRATTRRGAANGLAPGGSAGEHKPGKMTPQQAADAAWDETVAHFGGNPYG